MKIDFQNTEEAFRAKTTPDLVRSYLTFQLLNYPFLVKLGALLTRAALSLRLPIRALIRATIFREFCGGETLEESLKRAKELAKYRVGTILDVAVEGSQSEKVFEETTREILRTIDEAEGKSYLPFTVFKLTGIARFSLLEKLQKKESLTQRETQEWQASKDRFLKLCERASQKNVRVLVDAEESWIQDCIDEVTTEMMEKYNRVKPIIYNTIQMYRKDRPEFLAKSLKAAKDGGYILGVKLVRGAYLEKETKRAELLNLPSPLFYLKGGTDNAYDEALEFCMNNIDSMALVAGTHNEISTQHLIDQMERVGLDRGDERVYFSQLYGMSDHLSFHLAKEGYHVAKYLPYGDVRVLMPYLIRRAQENTAIHGQTPRELRMLRRELSRRVI